ncbi:MAG: hypothetical protein ACI9OU_001841 [Candidatus Promineifilaceae bacterium]|jgi:hypothetical protein
MDNQSQQVANLEEEVWNAIAAFEQILEAMPNDRASLEALCHAYEQIGDHTRAKDYVIRLVDVLVEEGDGAAAKRLSDRLVAYSDGDNRVVEALKKLGAMGGLDLAVTTDSPSVTPTPSAPSPRVKVFSLAEELSFAWSLLEEKLLTQEEYGSLVQDLTELSARENNQTISVLHALEIRGYKGLERVLASVSKSCVAPLILLNSFDVPRAAMSLLPIDFMMRRGVLPFDFVSDDLLVVVMNPFDKQLRSTILDMTGRNCHFYLTIPSEFDATLAKIRKALEEA